MAEDKTIKGLVIDITAETSGLVKQIRNIKSEFSHLSTEANQLNNALKLNPDNATYVSLQMDVLESKMNAAYEATLKVNQLFSNELAKGANASAYALAMLAEKQEYLNRDFEEASLKYNAVATGMDSYQKRIALVSKDVGTASEATNNLLVAFNSVASMNPFVDKDTMVAAYNTEITKTQEKVKLLSDAIQNGLNHSLSLTDPQMASWAKQLTESKTQLYALQAQVEHLETPMEKLAKEAEENRKAFKEADAEFQKFMNSGTKIGDINSRLATMKTQITDARTSAAKLQDIMNKDPRGLNLSADVLAQMRKELSILTPYMAELQEKMDTMKASGVDETSKEFVDLKAEIIETTARYGELTKGIADYTAESKNGTVAVKTTASALKDETADVDENSNAMDRASNSTNAWTIALGNLAARAITRAISGLKQLAQEVYNTGSEFESGMASLAAIYGVDSQSDQIAQLSDYFRELAINSKYSATEIAENAQVLANAGYDVEQTQQALEAINNLATGTGESFETMANVVVDGLHAFGMEASDAEHFANALAKTAVSSNTNVEQLGEAFQYAGTIAGSFGYSIEDVGVALGMMASNGIKGSTAGTALRQIITRLAADTSDARVTFEELGGEFYDAEGNALPLMDVLKSLRSSLRGLTDKEKAFAEYTIAGQRGLTALNAIVEMSDDDFKSLTEAVYDSTNQVKNMANTKLDTLSGQVSIMKNNFEETKIELLEGTEPALKKIVERLTEIMQSKIFKANLGTTIRNATSLMKKFSDALGFVNENFNSVTAVAENFATLALTSFGLGKATKGIQNFAKMIESIKDLSSASVTLDGVLSTITLIVLGMQGVMAVYNQIKAAQDDANPALVEIRNNVESLKDTIDSNVNSTKEQISATMDDYNQTQLMIQELDKYVDANGRVKKGYEERVNYLIGELNSAYGTEMQNINGVISGYDEYIAKIKEVSEENAKAAFVDQINESLTNSITSQAEALANMKSSSAEYKNLINDFITSGDYTKLSADAWTALGTSMEDFKAIVDSGDIQTAMQIISDNIYMQTPAIAEAREQMTESARQYGECTDQIGQYQQILAAGQTGTLQDMEDAYSNFASGITEAGNTAYSETELLKTMYDQTRKDLLDAQARGDEETAAQLQLTLDSLKSMIAGYNADENTKIRSEYDTDGSMMALSEGDAQVQAHKAALDAANHETNMETASANGTEEAETYTDAQEEEIDASSDDVSAAAGSLATAVDTSVSAVLNYATGKKNADNYVSGIVKGLLDGISRVKSAATQLANAGNTGLAGKNGWNEHSPSKVSTEYGELYTEGASNGILKKINQVRRSASALATAANSSLSGAMEVGSYVSTPASSGSSANTLEKSTPQMKFEQNIYSPKSLSRIEIYRDTKTLFAQAKGLVFE